MLVSKRKLSKHIVLAILAIGMVAGPAFVAVRRQGSTPETRLHSGPRGAVDLTSGQLNSAIRKLTAATAAHPHDARLWSDLSAALYERASTHHAPEVFCTALSAAQRAQEIDSSLPEAAFNRAITLEALGLRTLARRAYTNYLVVDSAGVWADEARRRLGSMGVITEADSWRTAMPRLENACLGGREDDARKIVLAFTQQSRSWAEGEYLARWGNLAESNLAEADRWLRVARCAGNALKAATGERLPADAVAAIDAATPDSPSIHALASGHVNYRAARIAYKNRDLPKAIELFERSRADFAAGQSPLELVVGYYMGNVAYDRNEMRESLAMLDAIAARTPPGYLSLHAQIDWERSLVIGNLGGVHPALDAARRSMAAFNKLGERANAAQIGISAASMLSNLGRPTDGWSTRLDLFREISSLGDPGLLEKALGSAAADEVFAGNWSTAAALYREISELHSVSARWRADALLWSAFARQRAGSRSSATDTLADARAAAISIADKDLRAATLDDVRFAEASLIREKDPRRAAALLDETIAYRRHGSVGARLIEAYVERARARRSMGDETSATNDLNAAIEMLDKEPVSIEFDIRNSFFGAGSGAFDEAIELSASRSDVARAFELVERAQARVLLSRLTGRAPVPVTLNDVMARLPRDTAFVQLTTLPAQSLAIVIREGGFRAVFLPIGRREIDTLTDGLSAAAQDNDQADFERLSKRISHAVLSPIAGDLATAERWIVAADDHFAAIPFGAMRDDVTNKYVVERATIVMSPSATTYVNQRPAPASFRVALVIGDPAFDEQLFPNLPRLPAARDEAGRIAKLYAGTSPLLGSTASRQRFLAAAKSADIIHIAAHEIGNERDPLLSAIPMAPEPGEDGLLYLRDVAELRLEHAPVVVLVACGTATSKNTGRPVHNFAQAFLVGGSSAVLGSLWNIDDEPTRAFALAFHRQLHDGLSPAAALRDAQLSMLRSHNPARRTPAAWSGFQVYGTR